jgi:ATP-dependent Clp protease ATP-binding subunit ClpA
MESIPRAVDVSTATRAVTAQAQMEARRLRHHYLGPEHLLLGLLMDAEDPVESEPYASERRERGLTLDALRSAVRGELDRPA